MEIEGLDELVQDFANVMDLPDEVQEAMLNAEADVVVRAQREEIERLGLVDSGQLKDSIARTRKVADGKDGSKYLEVYPQGVREDGARNAEVGFIHEFGAPQRKIRASNWMRDANEGCADDAVDAAAAVYDGFLKKNNL